jgi:hypothetical protein
MLVIRRPSDGRAFSFFFSVMFDRVPEKGPLDPAIGNFSQTKQQSIPNGTVIPIPRRFSLFANTS